MAARWWLVWLCAVVSGAVPAAEYVALPGGTFSSVLPAAKDRAPAAVAPFELRVQPVTNGEFLAFVTAHPEWRRDRVAGVVAEPRYLAHWSGADRLGATAQGRQPVTQVSWFAASAYCASEGARLPTWHEWEYVAAADATRRDARHDPAWREAILAWYGRPSNQPLPAVGGAANAYGVRDMHGLVWEWVDDFNGFLVAADSREQGGADTFAFCGAGATQMERKEDYATLMRVAMLSALNAVDTTANMGFRCARSTP